MIPKITNFMLGIIISGIMACSEQDILREMVRHTEMAIKMSIHGLEEESKETRLLIQELNQRMTAYTEALSLNMSKSTTSCGKYLAHM